MKLVYAPRALRDLEDIADYLVEHSPRGAFNVLAAIKSSIDIPFRGSAARSMAPDAGVSRFCTIRISSTIASQAANC
jgi:plasmid stabilization system protein ParE